MGLGSDAFKSKPINPQAVDPLRPEYQGLSADLGSYARSLVGRQATPYNGTLNAPMSSGEMDTLHTVDQLGPHPLGPAYNFTNGGTALPTLEGPAFQGGRDALISDILSGRRLDPNTNPYLAQVTEALRTEGQKTLGNNLNMVDAMFGKSGMGPSSGRSLQGIETGRQSTQDINNTIASLLSGNYQQGLQEQMATLSSILPGIDAGNLSRYSTVGNMGLNADNSRTNRESTIANYGLNYGQGNMQALASILGMQGLPRTVQQGSNDRTYQEFLRQLNEPTMYAQLASQILSGSPQMQFMNPQYAPSQFAQILGGASQAGQAMLPFMLM